MNNFIKMLGAVFFGNLLTLFVVYSYVQYQTHKAEEVAAEVIKQSMEQIDALTQKEAMRAQARAGETMTYKHRQQEMAKLQAKIDAATRQTAAAKEEAWRRFYEPSKGCQSLNETNIVACGNEKIRARNQFEAQYR